MELPPIVKDSESLSTSDPIVPGIIMADVSGKLYKEVYHYQDPAGFNLEGFDHWIRHILPLQIGSGTLVIPKVGTIVFTNAYYIPPTSKSGTGELLPVEALVRGMNYVFRIEAEAELIFLDGTRKRVEGRCVIAENIPAMLGSSVCWLGTKYRTSEQRKDVGVCPNDPLGYFIVRGQEKVIPLQEKLRTNVPMVFSIDNKTTTTLTCRLTSQTLAGSTVILLVYNPAFDDRKVELNLRFMDKSAKGAVNTICVTQAFRMMTLKYPELQLETESQIWGVMSSFTRPEWRNKVYGLLAPSFLHLGAVGDDIQYLSQKQGTLGIAYETRKNIILTALENELFPQIPSGSPRHKLWMLSQMTVMMIEVLAGLREYDDRDNWSKKRLKTPATMMQQLFQSSYAHAIQQTQTAIHEKNWDNPEDVLHNFARTVIDNDFIHSFTGTWGPRGSYYAKRGKAVTEVLKRVNNVSPYSSLIKVAPPTRDQAKKIVRQIQSSQIGFVDLLESPEGKKIGLIKHLSTLCFVSFAREEVGLLDDIVAGPYAPQPVPSADQSDKLFMNGKFLGWVKGLEMRAWGVQLRRTGKWWVDTSIAYDSTDRALIISCEEERPIRPLLILENGVPVIQTKNLWDAPFPVWISEGCVEYIDPTEQASLTICPSLWQLDDMSRAREEAEAVFQEATTDQERAQASRALRRVSVRYTHCEVHPSATLSPSVALIPLANHNPPPRNVFQCNMNKQALGLFHSVHMSRFDSSFKVLANPQPPIFATQMEEMLGMDRMPSGETAQVAVLTAGGYNQEDSFIFNKRYLDMGAFRYYRYSTYTVVAAVTAEQVEKFSKPRDPPPGRPNAYNNLDDNGIVKIGTYVKEGDIIVTKIIQYKTGKQVVSKTNVLIGEEGRVDRVLVTKNATDYTVVKVVLRDWRRPEEGDKFAFRPSQKGTIGRIEDENNMPFYEDGGTPDIIFHPLAVPTRMTMGSMIEMFVSGPALWMGKRVDATSFKPFDLDPFEAVLGQYGFNRTGTRTMINGITGEAMEANVYQGPLYVMALPHNVKDKIQMRARGAVKPDTRQPVAGRSYGGGLKFGEMERDAAISHGATAFLSSRLSTVSDAYDVAVCYVCYTIAASEIINTEGRPGLRYVCRSCGNTTNFGKHTIPYSWRYFTQLLAGLGLKLKLVVERDPNKGE